MKTTREEIWALLDEAKEKNGAALSAEEIQPIFHEQSLEDLEIEVEEWLHANHLKSRYGRAIINRHALHIKDYPYR